MRSRSAFTLSRNVAEGFTLIELLVVIAIIAILAAVVILTLNPGQLLKQSRDSNRLSDMDSLNHALGIYLADVSSPSLGSSNTVYVSLADSSATCANLGLPALPAGWSYACATTSTLQNVDGTGWLPVNFKTISAGSPLGNLPTDPTNASSSGLYYTYVTSSTSYEVTALPESTKQKTTLGASPMLQNYPDVIAKGTDLTLSPLWNNSGLVGYWNLDEGSGSTATDWSGNGNTGTWSGTQAGSSGYYSAGKVGSWTGYFNGSNDQVDAGNNSTLNPGSNPFSVSLWMNPSTAGSGYQIVAGKVNTSWNSPGWYVRYSTGAVIFYVNDGGATQPPATSKAITQQWHHVVGVRNGTTISLYVDGQFITSLTSSTYLGGDLTSTVTQRIGNLPGWGAFTGSIDDVRIYNRALSAAEIQAIYNATK